MWNHRCIVYINLLLFVVFCSLANSMEDTCERLNCGDSGWECRNMLVCDRSKHCNIAVPTCIYKDTSRYRVPNICPRGGHPVVDMSGKVVTCGGATDCPVGFTCRGGVCCPGAMADVALPICQSLVKPNYNLPLFSTLEVCGNHCTGDSECDENEICCFRSCGSKCVKIDPKAEAKTPPVIVTASGLSLSRDPPSSSTLSSSSLSPSSTLTTSQGSANQPGLDQASEDENMREVGDESVIVPSPNQYVVQGLTEDEPELRQDPNEFAEIVSDNDESRFDDTPQRPISESNPPESTSYTLGAAKIPRPTNDNSLSGPIPAKSIQVNAPGMSLVDEADTQGESGESDYVQKSSSCPANPTMVICSQRPCDRDSLCPGPTKCCPTRCGQKCVTPEAAGRGFSGRLNRLHGSLFRDTGAGNRRSLTPFTEDDVRSNPTNPNVFGRTLRNYGVDFNSERPGSQANAANTPTPESLQLSNVGEASGQGFFDPRERPLFQYGFRSPSADRRRRPLPKGPSIGNFRGRLVDPSSTSRTESTISQRDVPVGGPFSADDTAPGVVSGINRITEDQRNPQENDVIKNAVHSAFKLNPPPQPPNNARRSVANSRPTGGLLGGYALSFPDSSSSYPGHKSGSGVDISSGVAGMGFNSRAAPPPFGDFPGYGPNAFLSSPGASADFGGYDTMDAGAFGNINKDDYKKLGLDTVNNSFNKTKEYESRSSSNSN